MEKFYFIIMQNIDYFPDESVLFRYDLKFSEVNRKHVQTEADLKFIQQYMVNLDGNYKDLLGSDKGDSFFGIEQVKDQVLSYQLNEGSDDSESQITGGNTDNVILKKDIVHPATMTYEGVLFKNVKKGLKD